MVFDWTVKIEPVKFFVGREKLQGQEHGYLLKFMRQMFKDSAFIKIQLGQNFALYSTTKCIMLHYKIILYIYVQLPGYSSMHITIG